MLPQLQVELALNNGADAFNLQLPLVPRMATELSRHAAPAQPPPRTLTLAQLLCTARAPARALARAPARAPAV